MDQPGKVANPARGQLNRENNIPYELQFLLSGVLPVFQSLNYKLQRVARVV